MSLQAMLDLFGREGLKRIPGFDPTKRIHYFTNFVKKPYIVATVDPSATWNAAEQTREQQRCAMHPDLFASGTGHTDAGMTLLAGGGVAAAIAGANNTINIFPGKLTGDETSGLNVITWRPDAQPTMVAMLDVASAATTMAIIAGLRLTAPATADETTDNDFALIAFSSAVSPKWRGISKIAGGAVATVTAERLSSVATGQRIWLSLIGQPDRSVVFYVNDNPIGATRPLTAAAAFKPVLTVQSLGAGGRTVQWRNLWLSKLP